jgi:polyferredoxin
MHAFEHGKLIIEPNTLLYAGWGLVLGIPLAMWLALKRNGAGSLLHAQDVKERKAGWDLVRAVPLLSHLLRWWGLQYSLIFLTSVLLYAVVLTALFGTQMSGRNLGVMLTWIVWLFLLVVVLTPYGGRLWCLACPLPAVGEILQRGAVTGVRSGQLRGFNNRFFGLQLVWPRWLANGWLRMLVLLAMGVFSTALVATPRLTALVIIALVLMAAVMACIWELRAFCRYVCPVSAFVGLYGKAAKLELRAAHASVCARCTSHACEFGSERGWACPFGLRVSEIHENDHCGLCTECFKTCPHHNVTLRWRPFASEITIQHADQAWTSMTMFVLATAYVLTHLGHWPVLRDYVNILDKGNWHLLAVYAAVVWSAALVGLPLLMFALAAFGNRLSAAEWTNWKAMIASTGVLIPLGLMLWIAFTVEMAMVNLSFVKQSLSDPFGWGWDFFGTGGSPWHQLWPSAIPWIQVACVLVGFAFSLRSAWRIWFGLTGELRAALRGAAPLALLLTAVAGAFVWFFAD